MAIKVLKRNESVRYILLPNGIFSNSRVQSIRTVLEIHHPAEQVTEVVGRELTALNENQQADQRVKACESDFHSLVSKIEESILEDEYTMEVFVEVEPPLTVCFFKNFRMPPESMVSMQF